MITVTKTESFQRKVTDLLSRDEQNDLVTYLAEHPNAGDLIQRTSRIRKLRWARDSTGKSGEVRFIYYLHREIIPLYLLTAFSENEKIKYFCGKKIIYQLPREN